MPVSFAEQFSGVEKSHGLAVSLERAFDYARQGEREQVALEHLLLALTEDKEAIAVLDACNVSIDRLRTDVAGYLGRLGGGAAKDSEPVADAIMLRTIKHAEAAAKQSGRAKLTGAIVLAAIVGEGTSNAATLLQGQGLTFQGALAALQAASSAATVAQPTGQSEEIEVAATAAVETTDATPTQPEPIEPEPAKPSEVNLTPQPDSASVAASSVASEPAAANQSPTTEDVLASVRRRIEARRADGQQTTTPTTAQPASNMPAPTTTSTPSTPSTNEALPPGEPVPAPHPASVSRSQQSPLPTKPTVADLADKWARAIDGPNIAANAPGAAAPQQTAKPDPAPAVVQPAKPQTQQAQRAATTTGSRSDDYTGAYAEGTAPSTVPAMEPWPEPRAPHEPERQVVAAAPTTTTATPAGSVNGADDARMPQGRPVPVAKAPPATPQPASQPAAARRPSGSTAPASTTTSGSIPPGRGSAQARAAGSVPVPKRRQVRKRSTGSKVEVGQLLETIPRLMRVAVPATVELRIARNDVEALEKGMQGQAPVQRHDLLITKAMSVKLKAPDGGFWIETASPETQWIENRLGVLHDDFASWRWTVTPQRRGTARLQVVVSARTVGTDGLAAETQLPDQVVTVKVRMNYKKSAKTLGGWALAALAGGVVSAFGGDLMHAGSIHRLLSMIGL